jgi:uncharacterized protein YcfJ
VRPAASAIVVGLAAVGAEAGTVVGIAVGAGTGVATDTTVGAVVGSTTDTGTSFPQALRISDKMNINAAYA